jgi:hypothetical protein
MRTLSLGITFLSLAAGLIGADAKPVYQNTFDQTDIGKVPEGMIVLDGAFAVQAEGGNKFLELPGAPLESFGVLFGPNEKDGLAVSARIAGSGKGRRFPTFGVGLNGVGGFKLQVSPGKKLLELMKGDEARASTPFEWQSGKWTRLCLRVRKTDGEWTIEGKAWTDGSPEPVNWVVSVSEKEEPPSGRPMVFGSPFAGTPIRFDDLSVAPAGGK